jgi:muconate cycloisomerase
MRISDVEIIPVSVPFIDPFEIAGGRATHGRHVIVRATSENGEVGYGESAPMSSYSPQTQESVVGEIEGVCSTLRGRDPTDLEALHLDLRQRGIDSFALAGVDIALHDLAARGLGVPICRLIGGIVEEGLDLSWAIGFKPADAMAREARSRAEQGFGTVKIKVGYEPEEDMERVAAVRQAVGSGTKIKVDANQGYDLESAIRVGGKFGELGVSVFEQPLPKDDLNGLASLRERIEIPIMVDESLHGPQDALRILDHGAADIFNIKIMKPGGIRPSSKLASLAEGAGIPCMLGSMPELGVGTLGGLQLAASCSAFTYGGELIGPWMFEDDLLKERPHLVKGRLMLPGGPGLGLAVDEGKLERFGVGQDR